MFRPFVYMSLGLVAAGGCQGPKAYHSADQVIERSVLAQAEGALKNAPDERKVDVAASEPEQGLFARAGEASPGVITPATFTKSDELIDAPVKMPGPDEEIAPPRSPAQSFTLQELELMALSANPAVGEAEARVQAARGTYVQVGLAPNPVAGYQAGEIGDDGTAGQQGGFVSQQFVRGNKLGLNREVAAWQVRQAEQNLAALRQRVLTDVRTSYYDLLIAQESLRLTEKLYETSQQFVSAVQALRQAQEASQTDLLQAQVEADTAQMLVANAHASRVGAWKRLATYLGQPGLPVADVAGNPSANLPTIEFEEAVQRILTENPILASQYSEIEQARWALRRARAEVIPDVTVQSSVRYDAAGDQTLTDVQIGLPIPIWNRNQGGILNAQGELIAAERAASRTELSLQNRLATVYQEYQVSRQQVERYSEEILPKVDQTLELTRAGYREGEFDFLRLLTAQRTYFQTNLAYLESLNEMWRTSRQIDGLLLSDSLAGGNIPASP